MHAAALLACLALASFALGALGRRRVDKPRRGLRSFERTCLLDPLSLPTAPRPPQTRDTESLAETAAHISARIVGAEQAAAIRRFLRPHALALAALRFSGLSLLMANQQLSPASALDATSTAGSTSTSTTAGGAAEAVAHPKQAVPQPVWSSDDEGDESDMDQYEEGSSGDESDDENDSLDEEADGVATAAADEKDAQQVLLDGLQFYMVLTQVGAAAVRHAVHQAVRNASDGVTHQRAQTSISTIRQRYPDILCLSTPSTTRADLASALRAVSTPPGKTLPQPCSSMQRHVTLKRPGALVFAADDVLQPMTRTPLASPSAQTQQQQLDASFLQAA